jgi:hypothetical protein
LGVADAVSPATLQRLTSTVAGFANDPAARHAAFMLLQAAGEQPATLFRETDEEDAAAAGVSQIRLELQKIRI